MSGLKVLVVDDSPMALLLARQMLQCIGFEARTAAGAQAAHASIAASLPDVALIDLAMPETDGLSLARALRADPRTRGMVLIAHSSLDMDGALKPALDEVFDAKITKGDLWTLSRHMPAVVA